MYISLTMVICSWVCPVIMEYMRTMLSRIRMICVASTCSVLCQKVVVVVDDAAVNACPGNAQQQGQQQGQPANERG